MHLKVIGQRKWQCCAFVCVMEPRFQLSPPTFGDLRITSPLSLCGSDDEVLSGLRENPPSTLFLLSWVQTSLGLSSTEGNSRKRPFLRRIHDNPHSSTKDCPLLHSFLNPDHSWHTGGNHHGGLSHFCLYYFYKFSYMDWVKTELISLDMTW